MAVLSFDDFVLDWAMAMNMWKKTVSILIFGSLLCAGCMPKKEVAVDPDGVLGYVDDEVLDEADFELSQGWMPAFVRQIESNSVIEVTRFWSLMRVMLMSHDAYDKHYLTDAERSLAIKEALAEYNRKNFAFPNFVVEESEIDAYLKAHPDEFMEPMAFTVNYALIKNESSIPALIAGVGLVNGAQMGYNFVDPPELEKTFNQNGPLMKNEGGHPMNAKKFNFAYLMNARENKEEQAQMGPFTAEDGLLFSCPEAIEVLKTAPIGQPINHSIECSGSWKAFVIPEWRRETAPMSPEKARQVATEKILSERREAYLNQYIEEHI